MEILLSALKEKAKLLPYQKNSEIFLTYSDLTVPKTRSNTEGGFVWQYKFHLSPIPILIQVEVAQFLPLNKLFIKNGAVVATLQFLDGSEYHLLAARPSSTSGNYTPWCPRSADTHRPCQHLVELDFGMTTNGITQCVPSHLRPPTTQEELASLLSNSILPFCTLEARQLLILPMATVGFLALLCSREHSSGWHCLSDEVTRWQTRQYLSK